MGPNNARKILFNKIPSDSANRLHMRYGMLSSSSSCVRLCVCILHAQSRMCTRCVCQCVRVYKEKMKSRASVPEAYYINLPFAVTMYADIERSVLRAVWSETVIVRRVECPYQWHQFRKKKIIGYCVTWLRKHVKFWTRFNFNIFFLLVEEETKKKRFFVLSSLCFGFIPPCNLRFVCV